MQFIVFQEKQLTRICAQAVLTRSYSQTSHIDEAKRVRHVPVI